jgi:hypothetical protein
VLRCCAAATRCAVLPSVHPAHLATLCCAVLPPAHHPLVTEVPALRCAVHACSTQAWLLAAVGYDAAGYGFPADISHSIDKWDGVTLRWRGWGVGVMERSNAQAQPSPVKPPSRKGGRGGVCSPVTH